MVFYFNSDYFGQVALPQVDDNTFAIADGGRIMPEDGSMWASGAYIIPANAIPSEGQFVKVLTGVTAGTGGTFDFGIINDGAGQFSICRWDEAGNILGRDYTGPIYELIDGVQNVVSVHWGCRFYDNDVQNPPQLCYWLSPGIRYNYAWNDTAHDYIFQSSDENVRAFDSDGRGAFLGNPSKYSVYGYSGPSRGNDYLNSNVSTANGGAAGFLPADYTGGDSSATMGNGEYARFGDNIGFGEGYTSAVLSCGLIAMFFPTASELYSLADYMTSDSFFDNLSKMWSDPLESIISLSIFPTAPDGANMIRNNIILGGVNTGVEANKLVGNNTTRALYFGSVNMREYFKGQNYLDYDTNLIIYLPYIGFRQLNAKDVMDCNLELRYRVDFINGDFIAELVATTLGEYRIQRNILSERGNMAIQIPLTSTNYMGAYQGILNAGTALLGGDVGGALGNLAGKKVSTEHSGSVGGSAAAMGNHRAYILIDRPAMAKPADYGKTYGYPLQVKRQLSSMSGYVAGEINALDLDFMTAPEVDEFRNILRGGIVI